MSKTLFRFIVSAAFLLSVPTCTMALSPRELLVVYNTAESVLPVSRGVAEYYAAARGVPSANVVGILCPTTENATANDYTNQIATPLSMFLLRPEHSHIKCIVLCYGIPSEITYWDASTGGYSRCAVDSALTLLGNDGYLATWQPGHSYSSPYCGKKIDFCTFRDSAENVVPNSPGYRLNYLVCRLDGLSTPTVNVVTPSYPNGVEIPLYVKQMIDKSLNATPGGKLVIDRPEAQYIAQAMIDDGVDPQSIISDSTSVFLTQQQDVMGYFGEHLSRGDGDNYTTWGRPYHNWHNGGVAIYNTNDGQSFRKPRYFWGSIGQSTSVEPGKLKVINMRSSTAPFSDQYAGHQVVLCDANGDVLHYADGRDCRATFSRGVCTLDLANVVWPADHKSKMQIRFPVDDPLFPDACIEYSTTPLQANDVIYNSRVSGITLDCYSGPNQCIYGRVLSAAYVAEGASGTISAVSEPGAEPVANYVLSRYRAGYTWAESAYMGLWALAQQGVVLGDPLMCPYQSRPTVAFAGPTPADGSRVTGHVTIRATAAPDGSGNITSVSFEVVDGPVRHALGSATTQPYKRTWNSLELDQGTRVYPDGTYTIEATVHQAGSQTVVTRSITVDSTLPTVFLTNPASDYSVVSASTVIEAQAGGSPSKVQFWLFGEGECILVGEDTVNPYQCSISPATTAGGVYELQAVALYDTPASASYSSRRIIALCNDADVFTSVASIAGHPAAASCYLANVPVVAGTSDQMGGAFYVEDSNRVAGIRVEAAEPVATGSVVMLKGTLVKQGEGIVERCFQAERVWVTGAVEVPAPLAMSNAQIGGSPLADIVGITGGVGVYNVGILVRTWGKVTYVGSDFIYIDDGSGLRDGNTLAGPYVFPPDGRPLPSPVPHDPPSGIRIYCGSLRKPGVGDYVCVTGISSTVQYSAEGPVVRYLRPRAQGDITYANSYTRCAKELYPPYNPANPLGYFVDADLNMVPVGSKVRMVSGQVVERYDPPAYNAALRVRHYDPAIPVQTTRMWIDSWVYGHTQLPVYSSVTVTGISGIDPLTQDHYIVADCIYLGGRDCGALSLDLFDTSVKEINPSESGTGPFRPSLTPSADELLASLAFQRLDNRPGCIGWVLAQPDGAVVDLVGECISEQWYGGQTFSLKEPFEPARGRARLVLYMPQPVAELTKWRQIDIIGGTLATLSNGQRALLYPQAVYVYEDSRGRWMPVIPKVFNANGELLWPISRKQVYP